MSRSGRFGPIVSSRSCGPDPASSTTPGNGPSPVGIESVPGSSQGEVPTVTSVSVKAAGSTYAAVGGRGDGELDPAGTGVPRWSPATRPSALTVTMSGTVAVAKATWTVAFV